MPQLPKSMRIKKELRWLNSLPLPLKELPLMEFPRPPRLPCRNKMCKVKKPRVTVPDLVFACLSAVGDVLKFVFNIFLFLQSMASLSIVFFAYR